jgi:uncharacterized NAD-dependent epimerase/dehydratase family protein
MNETPQPTSQSLDLPTPYLLFLGDSTTPSFAKTAFGLRDWAPERCLGEFALPGATVSTGLERLTPEEAVVRGARAVVIGVANIGGHIPDAWVAALTQCIVAGLHVISGMHTQLSTLPALREAATQYGKRLIDIRVPPPHIPIATGRKRSGKRLLTVGTDCALGKKYTALAIARGLVAQGVSASFRATGQTGILIAGGGMPMDAVIADFESGAAEMLSPDNEPDHWDIIEGQGSLFHPAYAAVSLGLLHGSQPDVFVACHEPGRIRIVGLEDFALPSIEDLIDLTLRLGRRTNPAIRCAGVSLNTAHLDPALRADILAQTGASLGLPVADPMQPGPAFDALLGAILQPPA